MQTKIFMIGALFVSALLTSCGNSQQAGAAADSSKAAAVQKFPEPTDSLANGLHPYYPTEQNILGKWVLHNPTDTIHGQTDSHIEFLPDHTIAVQNYTLIKPVKWELNGNVLIMTHESGDPLEKGRMLNDTLVIEAVSDTSVHYFNLHEPNFILHLSRKK
jgi:hypothetical protein